MIRMNLKAGLVALGFGLFAWSGAQAAVQIFHPCVDVEGQGFAGMPCTVGPDDFGLSPPNSVNDTQTAMETVLGYLFGEAVAITDVVNGLEADQSGFDFNPDGFTGGNTVTVQLGQQWTFATVKSDTYWVLYDVRGLSEVALTTTGYIENNGNGKNISHISFWNHYTNHDVPVPATLALLGVGLLGVGAAVRRRRCQGLAP